MSITRLAVHMFMHVISLQMSIMDLFCVLRNCLGVVGTDSAASQLSETMWRIFKSHEIFS